MRDDSMFDSCSFTHQFKINLAETKDVAIGHSVSSANISSAGGHLWRIHCYPRGESSEEEKGDYLSVFLQHESGSKNTPLPSWRPS
ncbi:unnamed protein product [Urochloa humidicola]